MDFNALYVELEGIAQTVWPEAANADRGIWQVEQIVQHPTGDIDLPVVVLEIGEAQRTHEFGRANTVYVMDVSFYYVMKTSARADLQSLRSKLELMRSHLDTLVRNYSMTDGQVIEVSRLSWNWRMPLNQVLRAKKLPVLCGVVGARVIAGYTP